VSAAEAVLAFVVVERLLELAWSRTNTRRLLARGAVERAPGHYRYFVLLHVAWLAAIAFVALPDAPADRFWLTVYVALQVARVWVMASLGRFWTTRIITIPDAPLVRRGPYRFVRHPNYWIVAAELAVLPLIFGQWAIAAVFTVANALLLRIRIASEDEALAPRRTFTSSGS
jgi:methyltransferase